MPDASTKSKFKEATNQWRLFNWNVHLLIGLVGIVVICSVSFGFFRSNQLYQKYVPLIDASMEMRLEATTAYLWFEEMLGGDKSKNMEDILLHLDRADWYAKAMIEGGESEHLKLMQHEDLAFRDDILKMQRQLTTQRKLMLQRIEDASKSGPGSDIDKRYHQTLDEFIQKAIALEIGIKRIMVKDYQAFKHISYAAIAVCLVLFLITGYAFYRYEHLRQKSYAESLRMEQLLARNEKLSALGTMISGLAHEMNNPNNFISLNIPILREYIQELLPIIDQHAKRQPAFEIYDMPYQEFHADLLGLMTTIENGSNRINRIVSALKLFSRKKDQVKNQQVSLKKVIEKAVEIGRVKIDSAVESFETNVPEDVPDVLGDAEAMQIIIINLLLNAADAADKKDSWIRLRTLHDAGDPEVIQITIEDNGCGIKADEINRVFDPFYSTKSHLGSGGMGLYLCRALADQMGAHIDVQSEIRIGSTFTLSVSKHHNQQI